MDSRQVGSVIDAMFDLAKNGFEVAWDRPSSVALSHNRNVSMDKAIKEKYDYILYWDSDIVVKEPYFVRELIKEPYYFNALPIRLKTDEIVWNIKPEIKSLPLESFEVDKIGFGIFLINVETIKQYMEPPWFIEKDSYTDSLSIDYEDYNFCKIVRDMGFDINANPKFTTIHYGEYGYISK